ncbi:NUDIX domain-containing protein [Ascidiaceihabitans sp.]|uniref:NUDIX domain-containing protein n=1 Tax=Ascidiaceihabitans sp. TaxID=1872644 RepID=UPI003298249A
MKNLFVYGTLRHVPLLEIVLGRPAADIRYDTAILPDHSVFSAQEGAFPLIKSAPGDDARGLLLIDLSDDDVARLDFYEGGYGYELRTKWLRNGRTAEIYFPPEEGVTAGALWVLSQWADHWAELTCIAAREVMSYFGTRTPETIVQMYPMIRARAASQIAARDVRHGGGTLNGVVDVMDRTRIYSDFFALDALTLSHEKFRGGMSNTLQRAVFIGADAAIVLPYDPIRDCVLLVEQLRVGPIGRGDAVAWQYEPIAGRVDAGEQPMDCARREAQEEAGLVLDVLEPIAEGYPSPGTSSEFFYVYVGVTDLSEYVTGVSGLDTENEDIRTHILTFDALMTLVQDRAAANIPLSLCAYWLAHNRDRLRANL